MKPIVEIHGTPIIGEAALENDERRSEEYQDFLDPTRLNQDHENRRFPLDWNGASFAMNLFWWILVFGLFTMLLGGGLMAVLLSCTMDNQFRFVVRLRKREELENSVVPEFEAEVEGIRDHGVPLEMRRT
jgi:hypothetical protein